MKKLLLVAALSQALAAQPPITLLRHQASLDPLAWRARWEWQGARRTLQHLGLKVQVTSEEELARKGCSSSILVLANARNLSPETQQAVRQHLASGGRLLATYQSSYQNDGLGLGPELGVRFLRRNNLRGETEALQVAAPYGRIGVARHQGLVVESHPEATVLATWEKPEKAPAIIQRGGALFLCEDLLAPENAHSLKVVRLLAGLFNRLDPSLRLRWPRQAPARLEPEPPFEPLPSRPDAPDEPEIRVGLGSLGSKIHLRALFSLRDGQGKPLGKELSLEARPGVNQKLVFSGAPYLHLWNESPEGTAHWNAYRGVLEIEAREGQFFGINRLPGDAYLAGVIPSEVPASFPPESLKAMAVVARTYASGRGSRHPGEGYDLCSEIHCQVYRGLPQEHPATTAAVLQTRGERLWHGEQLAQTLFHACCGGHGVDVQAAWPRSNPLPYLAGTYDQLPNTLLPDLSLEEAFRPWLEARHPSYCQAASRFRWQESYTWEGWRGKVEAALQLKEVKSVKISRRDRSGRVAELQLEHATGNTTVEGDAVRWLTSGGKPGPGALPSSLFYLVEEVKDDSRQLRFVGGGWGHGIGLCQEGAAGRARGGANYRQILEHYYPGANIERR